ncbi:MAG: hypothetical protein ACXVCP_02135 [Bdellovibrio sp.]
MKKYLAVFVFIAIKANAANHFVREGATGSANGNDWVNAYTSLPADLIRGDIYYIAAGSYPGRSFDTPENGSAVISIKKAIESDHGIQTGWQPSYGTGQAVFTSGFIFSTANWIFDGQTGGGPGNWKNGFGFRINHTTENAVFVPGTGGNVTMRHVEIQGNLTDGVQGIKLYGPDNFTISYFYTDNIGNCPFIVLGTLNFLAEYGYVGKYSGSGSNHSEIASTGDYLSGTTTFRYNIFANVVSTGGLMWDNSKNHAAQLQVYGNIFYQAPTSTIDTWNNTANGLIGGWTGANGEDMYNMRIYNNTFYNTTGRIFTNFVLRSGDNEVKNNIFFNSTPPQYDDIQTHDYNLYINSGDAQSEIHGAIAASGDPVVDSLSLDFRLKTDTVAGTPLSSPYDIDPLGTVRGVSGIFDRGAFQFQGNGGGTILLAPTNLRVK